MRVCVHIFFIKNFSGTAAPRILKFGTNVGYDFLYCVKENQPTSAYHSLFVLFSFSPIRFSVTDFLAPMREREPESSTLVYTLRVAKFIVGKKTKMLGLILAFFPLFSISHSKVIHRVICVKDLLCLGF